MVAGITADDTPGLVAMTILERTGTNTLGRPAGAPGEGLATTPCQVDVVIPVYNEEGELDASVRRLHAYLADRFPFTCRITIADNASTDRTWEIAQGLAAELAGVAAVHLDRKGRGRALRQVWSTSDAVVVAYMDVDLSTDLDALLPLVSPLLSGHSQIAIGSRLAPGARVTRGPKREFISRTYNLLLRSFFQTDVRDAQCGFKAIRADVARQVLPLVENDNWFFDTELLLLARRRGLRVFEVPVDWVDDPDTRVNVTRTIIEDLLGMARMGRRFVTGEVPSALPPGLVKHAGRFAVIGAVSTVVHLALFVALEPSLGAVPANLVALALATIGNTVANRRYTFGVVGPEDRLRHAVASLALFLAAAGLSTMALMLTDAVLSDVSVAVQVAALFAVQVVATVARFVSMRSWVFAPSRPGGGTHQ